MIKKNKPKVFDMVRSKSSLEGGSLEKDRNSSKVLKKSKSDTFYDNLHINLEAREKILLEIYRKNIDNLDNKFPNIFHEIRENSRTQIFQMKNDKMEVYGKNEIRSDAMKVYEKEVRKLNKKYDELRENIFDLGEEHFKALADNFNKERHNIDDRLQATLEYGVKKDNIDKMHIEEKSQVLSEISATINSEDSWRRKFYAGIEAFKEDLFKKVAKRDIEQISSEDT
jgi:DNA mismatch repair ATPase MutS